MGLLLPHKPTVGWCSIHPMCGGTALVARSLKGKLGISRYAVAKCTGAVNQSAGYTPW